MPAGFVLTHAVQRIAVAAALLACLSLLWIFAQTALQTLVLFLIVVAAAFRPAEVVLATVAAAPVAKTALARSGWYGGATVELLALATATGCLASILARRVDTRDALAATRGAAAVLAVIVAASLFVELAAVRVLVSPELFWHSLAADIETYALLGRADLAGRFSTTIAALTLLEGVLFFFVVITLPGGRRTALRVLQMFVAGAAAAASLTVVRLAGAVLRSEAPVATFWELLGSVRLSVGFADVNAAGSFFVLAVLAATGFAVTAHDRTRAIWIVASLLCGSALWLSGSRAAFLAGLFAAALWVVWQGGRTARRALPVVIVIAVVGIWAFPNPIVNRSAVGALSIRVELAKASWRLFREAPTFGIGIGRFYAQSSGEIRDPDVRALYPRENAHNNYLQILTELGVAGFAAFLAVLALALMSRRQPARPATEVSGVECGLAAFLITCLAGHPLLTPEVSLTFWAVLGAVAAVHEGWAIPVRFTRTAAVIAIVLIATSTPFRVSNRIETVNLARVAYGLGDWEQESGDRFRRMTPSVTLFVPSDATAIELPYRLLQGGEPATIEVTFAGRPADRLVVADTAWRTYRTSVVHGRADARFLPLALTVSAGNPSHVALGQLTVRGTAATPR